MTTLDDLKAAIAKVEDYKALPLDLQLRGAVWGASRERDAWRTAFEWLHEDVDRCCNQAEYEEGMALIRGKLK